MDSLHVPGLLDFLGRISHELRTPLNSLLILSRRLAENDERNLTPKQMEYARTIEQSGGDLLELIDELLDLTRMEADAMPIERSWIQIADLIAQIARTFREAAEEKHLELEISADPAVPDEIETDPKLLMQILRNLLSNAIKFTDVGKVSLKIDVAGDERISFQVEDTGIGIPKEEHRRVFDAYRRGHRRAPREGVGLGLSISRKLSELLEGELELESTVGQGSVFRLVVPHRLGATKRRAFAPKRTQSHVKQPTLLVIHGSSIRPERFKAAARETGSELAFASSGEKGLRLARELKPRAIIMDTSLPDLEGWILLDVFKRDPTVRHVPVLAICGAKDARRARRLGAFDHAPPPRSDGEIVAAIAAVLRFAAAEQRTVLVVGGRMLEWPGIEVEWAPNGRDALTAVAVHRPDCIVIPPALDDMSAIELTDRLQRTAFRPPIPSIVYAEGQPAIHLGGLGSLADVVIAPSDLAPALLTDAIARFLHLPEDRLPDARRAHLEKLRTSDPLLVGRKMMIVDDDVYSIFALTSVLERHQVQVSFCESGREAIGALRKSPVDAVLLDIVMPDMDGFETIQRIRADPASATLPIIAVTARAMPGDREACLSAGADDYVPKPVDIDRLLAHLRGRLSASHG